MLSGSRSEIEVTKAAVIIPQLFNENEKQAFLASLRDKARDSTNKSRLSNNNYRSIESQQLLSLIKTEQNDDVLWRNILEFLALTTNQHRTLYSNLLSEIERFAKEIVEKHVADENYKDALTKLKLLSDLTSDISYEHYLGECYRLLALHQDAYKSFLRTYISSQGYEEGSFENSTFDYCHGKDMFNLRNVTLEEKRDNQLGNLKQCLITLIQDAKSIPFLKANLIQGEGSAGFGNFISNVTRTSAQHTYANLKGHFEESSFIPVAVPAVAIGAAVGGFFQAMTQDPLSSDEQRSLIDNLHKLISEQAEKTQQKLIADLVQQYNISKKQSSKHSRELLSTLEDKSRTTKEKIEAIIGYMLTPNLDGLLENNGKKLFMLVNTQVRDLLRYNPIRVAQEDDAAATTSSSDAASLAQALVSAALPNNGDAFSQYPGLSSIAGSAPQPSNNHATTTTNPQLYAVYRDAQIQAQAQAQPQPASPSQALLDTSASSAPIRAPASNQQTTRSVSMMSDIFPTPPSTDPRQSYVVPTTSSRVSEERLPTLER